MGKLNAKDLLNKGMNAAKAGAEKVQKDIAPKVAKGASDTAKKASEFAKNGGTVVMNGANQAKDAVMKQLDVNIAAMSEAISNVKTGEVTYAVRDTAINGVEIKANDFMGILDGDIIVSKSDRIDSTKDLLKNAVDSESSVVTIFVGNNVLEDEVAQIEEYVSSLSDDVECQVVQGNQEIYSYIIAIE